MLEISGKTNLLEQNAYKYSLQDVAEPNLQRDIYTQGMVPKVPFNHRRVPMNMPEEIWITDTSLRDGQQSVEPYTVDQIVNIYKYLSRLGGPYGIIRQTEFFIYSKKDREALEKCMELGLKFPEITTWIRATKEDFRLVRDLGIRETGILVSCSDYHIFKKMKMTRRQAMDYYLATVADAFEAGVVPRCHLEDITRADFYGFVVPFVNELQKLSRHAGIPVKIRACDTMGYGIPYTEAALPRSVAGIIRASASNGTGTTIFTRRSSMPRLRGSTVRARSTARCSASASARATSRSRRWYSSTRRCAVRSTAWTRPSSPRSRTTSSTRSAMTSRR